MTRSVRLVHDKKWIPSVITSVTFPFILFSYIPLSARTFLTPHVLPLKQCTWTPFTHLFSFQSFSIDPLNISQVLRIYVFRPEGVLYVCQFSFGPSGQCKILDSLQVFDKKCCVYIYSHQNYHLKYKYIYIDGYTIRACIVSPFSCIDNCLPAKQTKKRELIVFSFCVKL